MTQAEAQAWCLARGITPDGVSAVTIAAQREWASVVGKPDIVKILSRHLEVIGYALGWGEAPDTVDGK